MFLIVLTSERSAQVCTQLKEKKKPEKNSGRHFTSKNISPLVRREHLPIYITSSFMGKLGIQKSAEHLPAGWIAQLVRALHWYCRVWVRVRFKSDFSFSSFSFAATLLAYITAMIVHVLRWLDWIFHWRHFLCLSINAVINKENRKTITTAESDKENLL